MPVDPRLAAKMKILGEIQEYAQGGQAKDLRAKYKPPPVAPVAPVADDSGADAPMAHGVHGAHEPDGDELSGLPPELLEKLMK